METPGSEIGPRLLVLRAMISEAEPIETAEPPPAKATTETAGSRRPTARARTNEIDTKLFMTQAPFRPRVSEGENILEWTLRFPYPHSGAGVTDRLFGCAVSIASLMPRPVWDGSTTVSRFSVDRAS